MALFTAETIGYPEALKLIQELKSAGIEASITAGGVSIYISPDQVCQTKEICLKSGASFKAGYSSHQEDAMLQNRNLEHLERVTNDAIAVIKEWKE